MNVVHEITKIMYVQNEECCNLRDVTNTGDISHQNDPDNFAYHQFLSVSSRLFVIYLTYFTYLIFFCYYMHYYYCIHVHYLVSLIAI